MKDLPLCAQELALCVLQLEYEAAKRTVSLHMTLRWENYKLCIQCAQHSLFQVTTTWLLRKQFGNKPA